MSETPVVERSTLWPALQETIKEAHRNRIEAELTQARDDHKRLEAGQSTVEATQEQLYGFTVQSQAVLPTPAAVATASQRVQALQEKLEDAEQNSFSGAAVHLKVMHEQLGVTPIAVVPAQLFKQLCQKFGLMRFEHLDGQGMTSFRYDQVEDFFGIKLLQILLVLLPICCVDCLYGSDKLPIGLVMVLAAELSVVTWYQVVLKGRSNWHLLSLVAFLIVGASLFWWPIAGGVGLFFLGFVVLLIVSVLAPCVSHCWLTLAQRGLIPSRSSIRILWPNGVDVPFGGSRTYGEAQVSFRVQPSPMFALLLKKYGTLIKSDTVSRRFPKQS